MENIQDYKCLCCGAPLIFDPESQELACESCGTTIPLSTMEEMGDMQSQSGQISKYDWDSYEPRSYEDTSEVELADYTCPSCGAEITGDDTLGSTVCPYCGNAAIVKGQFEGSLKPDYIIPFKIDKKAAMEAFENAAKNAPFLPDAFQEKKKIEEMAGIYVPFWMFDCDCDASITYDAQKSTSWSDANYNYTKIDHYKLFRSGKVGFGNIPVDGSKKADDAYMEALEPYQYEDAVTFSGVYLSGYLADKYDVKAEESIGRANERVKKSAIQVFSDTTGGYASVIPDHTSIRFSNGKIRYALLPVWMLNIRYMDQNYHFAINGQTGKVVGEYPVDKQKQRKYFVKTAAIGYAIAALIAYLLLF